LVVGDNVSVVSFLWWFIYAASTLSPGSKMFKNGTEMEIGMELRKESLRWRCGTWLIVIGSDIWEQGHRICQIWEIMTLFFIAMPMVTQWHCVADKAFPH